MAAFLRIPWGSEDIVVAFDVLGKDGSVEGMGNQGSFGVDLAAVEDKSSCSSRLAALNPATVRH